MYTTPAKLGLNFKTTIKV